MRLWSLHPKYLDTLGLLALWRESLLAKTVLEGKTQGYNHHPQLIRFQRHPTPLQAIHVYLRAILEEAKRRNYKFNPHKVNLDAKAETIAVTTGQLNYERLHLLNKLKTRDYQRYLILADTASIEAHPIMLVIPGPIEPWESVKYPTE